MPLAPKKMRLVQSDDIAMIALPSNDANTQLSAAHQFTQGELVAQVVALADVRRAREGVAFHIIVFSCQRVELHLNDRICIATSGGELIGMQMCECLRHSRRAIALRNKSYSSCGNVTWMCICIFNCYRRYCTCIR
jgi:hypothetical protein